MVARAIRSSAPRRIAALFGVITFATDYSIGIADLAKTVEEYGGDALAIYRASAYPIGSRSGRALKGFANGSDRSGHRPVAAPTSLSELDDQVTRPGCRFGEAVRHLGETL